MGRRKDEHDGCRPDPDRSSRAADQVHRSTAADAGVLSLLGYSLHVSRSEVWATMVGGSGQVALHDTASTTAGSGETGLMFEVPVAEGMAAHFAEVGFDDVVIYDEAWGRVLQVRGDGVQLGFDERPTDLYGYQL